MTIGWVLIRRQSLTKPPIGAMALSMSAAVVPGAKFCAITTKGPASPRMVIPRAAGAFVMFICEAAPGEVEERVTAFASLAARLFVRRLLAAGGLVPGACMRAANELGFG